MKITKSLKIHKADFILLLSSTLAFFLAQTFFHLFAFNELPLIGCNLYIFRIYGIHMIIALLLSLPVFIKYGKWISFLLLIFLTIILYSNLLYYRAFGDIIPINSYLIVGNLRGFEDSLIPLLSISDIFFILPIFIYIFSLYATKGAITEKRSKTTLFIISILLIIIVSPFIITKDILKDGTKEFILVYKYGLLPRIGHQIYNINKKNSQLSTYENIIISNYLDNNYSGTSSHTHPSKKNLIIIIVESLESWPLLNKINNQEITPNINSYLNKNINYSKVYFQKVRTQIKGGRSSDAQLLLNTGLLPIKYGPTCFQYTYNKYPSLANELKEHNNFKICTTMIGCPSFEWNQKEFSPSLGFDCLYEQKDYSNGDIIGGGLNDVSFLIESVDKLALLPKPFYAQLITLSSHAPFHIPEHCKKLNINTKQFNSTFVNYIHSINYVDHAIGTFITKLKKLNLYKNSIIIITGDHNTGQPMILSDWERKYVSKLYGEKAYIPFIVLNAPLSFQYENEVDQVDLYPTILNLMGTNSNWKGVGKSVLSKNYLESLNKRDQEIKNNIKSNIWDISNMIITKNYFTKTNLYTKYTVLKK